MFLWFPLGVFSTNSELPSYDSQISEFPDEVMAVEEDVNVGVALGEEKAEDDVETVGAGPAVILN